MAADLPDRIEFDPAIAFGRARIKRTRIRVALVLGLMADGLSGAEILEQYPQLAADDLLACLDHAARLAPGRFVDVV